MKTSVIRIVKMTFNPERIDEFLKLFDEKSGRIRSFKGCQSLDLIRDTSSENVMTTISVWASEEALAVYRRSDVFNETWTVARSMFADRPEASSYVRIRSVKPS